MSVWFGLRMVAGAVVAAYGADKLIRPSTGRAGAVALLGACELALATFWVMNPVPTATVATALAAGCLLTAAGTRNIRRTGSCGCGGHEARTRGRLLRRNAVLFGAIAAGAVLGPDADELARSHAAQVEAVLLAPATILVLVALSSRARPGPRSAAAAR